ncbi:MULTISPECIES: tryptophan halogenase family protein [Sphingomonas]|jgi:tryptophan halogenase|uniref:Tryptophan halogenase n=1 Tax=Sphingomonas hankookensis TaxID=563996 RepID=A0ABR5Y944_9SPHN|nr:MULTISPECIES: tryptophan halogenase family protein [Sphingomonas]KZE08494.1 tryptophan halogenase [Sphingomonas hankookensis]PZT96593.1 MAG: tryptophan 7-halogenase [Sphingomonas sp.]RSV30213.1 tryptophan 7-halogenase [Sphingomonas sp. ABOLH]WCP71242.1 tryptophan 7-halogenase [Sphingomonas hankookensis]
MTRKRIVIAGGGTAGWLAAALLTRQLAGLVDVTLVESEAIGTVGVGEATIPTIRSFHALLGLDERDFMAATGANFKLGIAFEGWARAGDRYIHSFGEVGRSTWMGDFQHFWLEAREQGGAADIGAYCLEHEAADAGRFLGGPDTPLNYAYHFDAGRYAAYLRERSEAQGLTRIEGRIARVERDSDSGDIAALVLDDGQHIAGDMFLDCTGFHALLIEQTLGVGFEDWGHWLPTDRALAVQTRATGPAVPYTRAIAHDAGWRWQIPLQHRIGNGLVYSSRHLGDDAARDRLMASVEGQALIEPRLIRFRTGRRLAMWERNCVALSLSSGFVEPLESTSLHLVMIALTRLVQLLPFGHLGAAARNRFNDQARREIEAVRDFVLLHYHLNERPEPFWRERKEIPPPDSLAERIALFAEGAHTYQSSDDLFRTGSWTQVMLGQRLTPAAWHPLARAMPPGELGTVLRGLQSNIAATVARLPTHQQFLDSYCLSRE